MSARPSRSGGGATGGCRDRRGKPHPRSYDGQAGAARSVRARLGGSRRCAEDDLPPTVRFGFADWQEEGVRADLVLFDPQTVQDLATYEDPQRLSRGFDVVVIGVRLVRRATRARGPDGNPLRPVVHAFGRGGVVHFR